MISVRRLVFEYPRSGYRLQVDSLDIPRDARVAIIGPSGAGKTTLLNLLTGILPADEGDIRVEDTRLSDLADAARRDFRLSRVGFVFQDFALVDYLTVLDNIVHPYRIGRALRLDRETLANGRDLATALGLGEKLRRYPAQLSHGERQRCAIGRALIAKPQIIAADEPTGNLDPENKAHIFGLLFKQAQAFGAVLLAVTHDRDLLSDFDQVIELTAAGAVSVR